MSSSSRTTSKGGKGAKGDKTNKLDKSDTGKGSGDKQQAGGGGDNVRSKSDDPEILKKIDQVIEMTHRSEEEVCLALQESEYDMEKALDMLFEHEGQNEWETSVKKKKNRQASSSKMENAEPTTDEWNEQTHVDKDKPRNKSGGGLPRLHGRHNDSRGWRGREKQENERNLEDGGRQDHRERRGRSSGPIRGGGGGRGRGGGRAGGRYPPRNNRNSFNNNRPIETWDNSNTWDPNTNANHVEPNWDEGPIVDDWSAEEYTGSLADTKVFTPSVPPEIPKESEIVSRSPIPEDRTQLPPQQPQMPSQSPVSYVGPLNAAQSQYISQLQQQNSDMKTSHIPSQSYGNASSQGSHVYSNAQYGSTPSNTYVSTGYAAVNTNYGTVPEVAPTQQPVRTKTQRARVPPPSKIPASAVEMPGDLNSVGYLDVQFGAMDLISDGTSFDNITDAKFSSTNNISLDSSTTTPSSNLDLNTPSQSASLDVYAAQQKSNTQSSISSALSQNLANSESIPQTSEHLTTGYSTAPRSSMQGSSAPSATPSAVDLGKQSDTHSYSQPSNYNSYQPKSSSYQTQSYNSPSYSTTQSTSSYVSNQPNNNYVNSNTGSSYNTPNPNTYQNAYSSASSYQTSATAAFPMSQANSYPSSNQAYPQNTSQSVYGANSGLNNSNYGNATSSAPQYSSYNSNASHKLVKDNTYDNSTTTVSSTAVVTTNVSTASSALSISQTTATGTKATTTLAKNSGSVVSNIPPGVAPVMSTPYIMSQGIPYFQQPIYSYEDVQLLQQRIPHMTTPFYEMSYQTPTTLTAVRDGALATYSMSDGRFTRGDNNASPVPSTLSQQTSTLNQGHQAQPMIPQTGPYFFAPYNPMQSYQFGVGAVYSQLPAVTNAHGSSNSNQYPKPGTYGSGYGSSYDTLSQTQDYTKGGYVGNTQGQNKGAGANASSTGSTGNELSMYSKSHTALGKVNSYEKQGFHSGTPPPFSGALHGSQNAGLAPSGTGYGPQVYIPAMAPHQQHHSTPLMHQPLHQMDVRHQGRRMDSGNTSGQRSQTSNQPKSGAKQYQNSYWNQA